MIKCSLDVRNLLAEMELSATHPNEGRPFPTNPTVSSGYKPPSPTINSPTAKLIARLRSLHVLQRSLQAWSARGPSIRRAVYLAHP